MKLLRVSITPIGENYNEMRLADVMGREYSLGLYLLSAAFPRVEHVVFPGIWQMPIGTDVVLTPESMPGAWAGVRTLELGSGGLPFAWEMGKRFNKVKSLVERLHPFNWPHVRNLIIMGPYSTADRLKLGVVPFRDDYFNLLRDKGKGCLEDMAMVVIEHPMIGFHRYRRPGPSEEPFRGFESDCRRNLENLMHRPEVQAEGWRSEMESRDPLTAFITFQRDRGPSRPFSYQLYDRFSDHDPVAEASDSDTY